MERQEGKAIMKGKEGKGERRGMRFAGRGEQPDRGEARKSDDDRGLKVFLQLEPIPSSLLSHAFLLLHVSFLPHVSVLPHPSLLPHAPILPHVSLLPHTLILTHASLLSKHHFAPCITTVTPHSYPRHSSVPHLNPAPHLALA